MLMQNFGVTNKEHYGMLWYFWSVSIATIPLEYSHSAIGHDTDPVARASSSWTIGITMSLSHGIAL